MEDRRNIIAGWVLGAGIVALGAGLISGEFFRAERPEKMGYPIEGVQEGGAAGAVQEVPIAQLLATADPHNGEKVFAKCAACHNATKGGPNAIGPNLWGVVGEAVGQGAGGFAFSDALKSKGGTWTFDALNEWLTSPRKYAPGTKMTFAGLSAGKDRADVIAYLNSQSDHPLPMPAPGAKAGDVPGGPDAKAKNINSSQAALAPGAPSNNPQNAAKSGALPEKTK